MKIFNFRFVNMPLRIFIVLAFCLAQFPGSLAASTISDKPAVIDQENIDKIMPAKDDLSDKADLPDLVIKNVKVNYSQNDENINTQVEFDIVNVGKAVVEKTFDLVVINEANGQVLKKEQYNETHFNSSEASLHVYVFNADNISKIINGVNKISINVDSNNTVTESNENNNQSVAVVNNKVKINNDPPVTSKGIDSPYLFVVNNQKDDSVKSDHDIFASFNRVILNNNRSGKGVERVGINLLKDNEIVDQCFVNLIKNTNTCSGKKSVSIIEQNDKQQALLKINLNPQYYDSASFQVHYSSQFKPNGWTVDIGDSISNDGWGGDYGDTQNDAEINVVNGDILVYGNDFSPQNKRTLAEFNKSVIPGQVLILNVAHNHFDWSISPIENLPVKEKEKEKPSTNQEVVNTTKEAFEENNTISDDEIKKTETNNLVSEKSTEVMAVAKKVIDESDTLVIKLQRQISLLEQKIVDLEKSLVTKVDDKLTDKVKGRILLQVEDKGQAWYVDPSSKNKLYLKDGQAAYDIMRALGLGIKNSDLEKIPVGIQKITDALPDTDGDGLPDDLEKALGTDINKTDTDGDGFGDYDEIRNNYKPYGPGKLIANLKLIERMKGKILLQVEDKGQAWYINPNDGKRYFLGDANTAYEVMRNLSLGINNDQLRKIQVGEYAE